MLRRIIGYLMYLSNGEGVKEPWYGLKDKLCKRFGVNNGYDVQYLEGKECYACDGTGMFKKYSFGSHYREHCYKCTGGWYKLPRYVLLERIKVGNYVFHKPIRSQYKPIKLEDSDVPTNITIDGYVWHTRRKFGWLAFGVLFLLFARKEYVQRIKTMGCGWKVCWWLPRNYLHNFMHLRKAGMNAIPICRLKDRWRKWRAKPVALQTEELPF